MTARAEAPYMIQKLVKPWASTSTVLSAYLQPLQLRLFPTAVTAVLTFISSSRSIVLISRNILALDTMPMNAS